MLLQGHRSALRLSTSETQRNMRRARSLPAGSGAPLLGEEVGDEHRDFAVVPGLHVSHRLWWCGGFTFCTSCGGTHTGAGGRRGLLPNPCELKIAPGGSLARLQKLQAGRLPYGVEEWPDAAAPPRAVREVRRVR